jgi:FtsH-binding integral membrane protein
MTNSSIYNRLFNNNTLKGGNANANATNLVNLLQAKQGFLLLVFVNLIVQLGITYFIFMKSKLSKYDKYKWLIIALLFVIILIIALVPLPAWLKFILFCVFSVLQGIFLSSIKTPDNKKIIEGSILSGLSIFGFFVLIGGLLINFGVKLGINFGFFLFVMLLLLILGELVNIFFVSSKFMYKVFSYISLFIFSMFIIYDTNKILQRNYNGDFITASLDYYLDILNVILDMFSLKSH